jgi:response regulator NasT
MNIPATGLRIAVADDERDMRQFFEEWLPEMGHEVVGIAETGRQLIDYCKAQQPDLIVTDIKMPDLDGISAIAEVNRQRETPAILVTAYQESDLLARSGAEHIMAFLVKPVKPADLQAAISLAVLRFEQYQRVRAEAAGLRQALEDRKVIEQAKGTVMHRLRLDEPTAYTRLRQLSSRHNEKLVALARRVLEADEVFQALEQLR